MQLLRAWGLRKAEARVTGAIPDKVGRRLRPDFSVPGGTAQGLEERPQTCPQVSNFSLGPGHAALTGAGSGLAEGAGCVVSDGAAGEVDGFTIRFSSAS